MENKRKASNFIPEGYHTITPILKVNNASGTIDFLKEVFGAKERYRLTDPNGDIMHAEVVVGDSIVMMCDSMGESPQPGAMYLYTEDIDSVYDKALKAGGVQVQPPEDQFYGDRSGCVKDPGGNNWWLATHVEDVSSEEMHKREEQYLKVKK